MTRSMNWERAATRDRMRETSALVNTGAGWWLTINGRDDTCAMCSTQLERGDVVVFNADVKETVCRPCSREAGVKPQQSRKYQAWKKQARLP